MKKAALVIACLAASWPAAAIAQNYPTKPIKMIVPISVGSITDVAARLTAQELEQRLGQSVIVINKPGAAMVLGGSECAKSDPDGYTLCVVSPDTMSFNPLTIPNLPYNPEKDFTPVIDMYHVVEGLMTPAASGINSIDELRAKAVAEPGKLNYGTLGERTTTDAFRQWLGEHWQTNFVAIPYKGGKRNHRCAPWQHHRRHQNRRRHMTSQLKEGKIKVLALRASHRLPQLPDVPTFAEAGFGAFPAGRSLGRGGAGWHAGADRQTPARRTLGDLPRAKIHRFRQPELPRPAAGSTEGLCAFLKKDRQDAAVLVDKYMK